MHLSKEPMDTTSASESLLPDDRLVSTAKVAEALGVSVTTVKRWVDDGIIPAYRTAGGHRKLLLADVMRLTRETDLPRVDLGRLIPPSRVAPLDTEAASKQLYLAAQRLDSDAIRAVIHGTFKNGLSRRS